LYDVHTGNDLTAPLPPLGLIGDLVWQPGSSLLAVTIPQQGTALLLDGGTGALIASVTHSGTELKALAFAPDGRSMVTGGYDGTIQLWRALLERDACRQAHEGLSPSLLRTLLGPGRPVPRCAEPAQVPDAEPLPVVYTQILAGG
jgi:WD40 repeat protein